MKWLKRIFDFYLDASIHVAFAVYALVQISFQTLNIFSDQHLSFFVFFGSISCYNFIKYGVEAEKYILVANDYQKGIQFLSFIAAAIAIYHGSFLSFEVWIGIIGLVLLTGLYSLPVLPKSKNLRSLGGLKIFIVALVWAGTTVLLPILAAEEVLSWDVGLELTQRFILVFILLIPFEIRDLAYDSKELNTLPQYYGVTKTKIFGGFAILLLFFMTFLKDELSVEELILKGFLFLILGIVLFITKRKQSKYFASFWVEAIPIFWFALSIAIERLFITSLEVALSF
ncbi:hypothetical protein [Maribacter sp. 2308TA10-17]|uniref:hypothetical protein n=1 Tax=Maribacter sp. 2308TA10-17 TaxID=3386276 RepID=UPI0039BD4C72